VAGAVGAEPGRLHRFSVPLTSFIGRVSEVAEVAGLLGGYRMVTVAGPGGVGKTRLAAEVAARAAGRFADGVWLVELATVTEPGQVAAATAAALGVPQTPGVEAADSLVAAICSQQVLLVLDNCEHVAGAVAGLCGTLLRSADDVRVLATSREPVGVAGEARYRLGPLAVPGPEKSGSPDGQDGDALAGSDAIDLFVDRARRVDPHFALTAQVAPQVARLMGHLDGMPLAIELAAAQVEALGVDQLLVRLGSSPELLAGSDRLAATRHRSLTAAIDWSYQLLSTEEQRAFRALAAFPGPFTMAGAEAVAGQGAAPVVLRLVDCSLLVPPRIGPDGRARYTMLETLRSYAASRLAEAGEREAVAQRLAGHAVQLAEQAAQELDRSATELDAATWLDAEAATVQPVVEWAREHDPGASVRLALALARWWQLRGRSVAGYDLLRSAAAAAARAHSGAAQAAGAPVADIAQSLRSAELWLGHLAYGTHDLSAALGHYDTAVGGGSSADDPVTVGVRAGALAGKASVLRALGRVPEAAEAAASALALARHSSDSAAEVSALAELALAAHYSGDHETLLTRARQACQIDPAGVSGALVRRREYVLMIGLTQAGLTTAAQESCVVGLSKAREVGDVQSLAAFLDAKVHLDVAAGRLSSAGAFLREALEIGLRTGDRLRVADCLRQCGDLCAAGQRWDDAVTMWSAHLASLADYRATDPGARDVLGVTTVHLPGARGNTQARAALGPALFTAAEKRGMAMALDTAAQLAFMLSAKPTAGASEAPPGIPRLSPREHELVMLVAQGRTDAQIAGQLHISIRTVSSHLDRIRDKTGCRRRADLTRLALQAGLV
jgi:predicted ATPase/DNA-binding CsgD family transcriptional regulator